MNPALPKKWDKGGGERKKSLKTYGSGLAKLKSHLRPTMEEGRGE